MPFEAKLILVGQIIYAGARGEITSAQQDELLDMLGDSSEWLRALSFALVGEDIPEFSEFPWRAPAP